MAYTPRINTGGNFCGHDPDAPRFTLARPAKKGKGGIPRVLTLFMERFTDYYHSPRLKLPSLDLANGSERQMRSERREACVVVMAAIAAHTDLSSLRVGIPTPSGFMSYTFSWIAGACGLPLRRVERAVYDLKAAGILTVSQVWQLQSDGTYKGLSAVKAVSRLVFAAFGLKTMLKIEMEKASKRLKKRAKEWSKDKGGRGTTTEWARLRLFLGSMPGSKKPANQEPPKPYRKPEPPPDNPDMDFEVKRQRMLVAGDLRKQHPDWDSKRLLAEAERIIRARYRA